MDIDRNPGNGYDDDSADDVPRKRGRGYLFWVIILIIVLGGGAVTATIMGMTIIREETPAPGEAFLTDAALRSPIGIPGEYTDMRIPDNDKTPDAIAKGKSTFEAECAQCHGQGGKGDADLGRLMYPPAVDLTADRTYSKTDGQLFWEIAHGVNLTGMPAWGTKFGGANTDDDIWQMIAFVRTLRK